MAGVVGEDIVGVGGTASFAAGRTVGSTLGMTAGAGGRIAGGGVAMAGGTAATGGGAIGAAGFAATGAEGAGTVPVGLRSAAFAAASLAVRSDSSRASASASNFRRSRTFSATSTVIELECVFFSVTPNPGSRSIIALALTSSSRASSLIRTWDASFMLR